MNCKELEERISNKFKGKQLSTEELKKEIMYYFEDIWAETFDTNNYKFNCLYNPTTEGVSIIPGDLATAMLLYKGIIIDKELTEYEDEEGRYAFKDGKMVIAPKKALEYITFDFTPMRNDEKM